jgi:flavin reductase
MNDLSLPRLDLDAHRAALRRIASTVHVVGLRGDDGALFAATATAVASVSFEPPTLLVCVARASAVGERVAVGMTLSLSALDAAQREVAQACAGQRPQAERAAFFREHHAAPAASVVAGALASFICRVAAITEWGTHRVVYGEVLFADCRTPVDPLVYVDGGYARVERLR